MMQAAQTMQTGFAAFCGQPTAQPYLGAPTLQQQLTDPNAHLVAAMHRLAAAIEKFNERNAK